MNAAAQLASFFSFSRGRMLPSFEWVFPSKLTRSGNSFQPHPEADAIGDSRSTITLREEGQGHQLVGSLLLAMSSTSVSQSVTL